MIDARIVAEKALGAGLITCDQNCNITAKQSSLLLTECGDDLDLIPQVLAIARKIHLMNSSEVTAEIGELCVRKKFDIRRGDGVYEDGNRSRKKPLPLADLIPGCDLKIDDEEMAAVTENIFTHLTAKYPPPAPAKTYTDVLQFGKEMVIQKRKIEIVNLNEMYYYTPDGCREDLSANLLKDFVTEAVSNYNMKKSKKVPTIPLEGVYRALLNHANSVKDELLQEARTNLKFDPKCVSEAEAVLLEMVHLMQFKQDDDIALLGLRQMLWQVKRYMFRYDTKYELWLQILAEGGVGKNVVLREILFKAIAPWYLETELSKLEDFDREVVKFRSALMINFDELAKGTAAGADLNPGRSADTLRKLKAIMTRPEFSVRELGTQNQMKFRKTFAFCSTANVPISTVFGDDSGTGNRRFLELESTSPRGIHWEMEHLFDKSELLWRSIDETNSEGYIDYGTPLGVKLMAIQNTYEAHNSISAWFDDECVTVDDDNDTSKYIQLKHLYPHYAAWAKRYGYGVFQLTSFSQWMKKRFKTVTDAKLKVSVNVTLKDDTEADSV